MTITELATNRLHGNHLLFVDSELPDDSEVVLANVERTVFENVGLKGAQFRGGMLKACRFRNSYLRKVHFENVNLTGTEFLNCNLRDARFTGCTMDYVTFKQCDNVDYKTLSQCEFEHSNVGEEFLHMLRNHATADGAARAARELLLLELAVRRQFEKEKAIGSNRHVREKFFGEARWWAGLSYLNHFVQDIGWGYGVKPLRLLRNGAILILLFAAVQWAGGLAFRVPANTQSGTEVRALRIPEALYHSVVTFSTLGYGDVVPAYGWSRVFSAAEAVTGAVFLSLLAASAFKRMEW